MPEPSTFYAFPSNPASIAQTIERAIEQLRSTSGIASIQPWPQTDIAGGFIADQILAAIHQKEILIGDISQLNFNVTFEIGYAIGKGRRVVITRNAAFSNVSNELSQLGIFDTLGYKTYQNSYELCTFLRSVATTRNSLSVKKPSIRRPLFISLRPSTRLIQ